MTKSGVYPYPIRVCVVMIHKIDGSGFAYLDGRPIIVVGGRSVDAAKEVIKQDLEPDKSPKWWNRGAWVECDPIEPSLTYYSIHEVPLTYS